MTELAIKSDMLELKSEMFALKSEVASLRDSVAMKSDLQAIRNELYAAIEKSALQTTIRLGGVVAVGVGILAALQRIH